jgi:hypothetical protein
MRWKLLRRRLSISAPRMIVRSHLPWPVRWAFVALMFGFSAALALWAFEFGKNLAGLNASGEHIQRELDRLHREVTELREDRDKAQAVAHSADSLMTAERATQQKLAEQVKALEAENLSLKGDLGFFERLLPAGASDSISVRGLQAESAGPGQLRFQLLVMQQMGRGQSEFTGRYELTLVGQMAEKPWSQLVNDQQSRLQFKQYQRVDGRVSYPTAAVVKQIQLRVLDAAGGVRATQTIQL